MRVGLVQGDPATREFFVVSSGPLPGPLPETFALLQILREAVPCKVYCDNATMCRYYQELLLEPFSLANWHTKADPDLWVHISELLFAVGPGLVQLEKVKARLDIQGAQSEHDAWLVLGNGQADWYAKNAQKAALQTRFSLQHKP